MEQSRHVGLAPAAWLTIKVAAQSVVLDIISYFCNLKCRFAGEVPSDSFDKRMHTKRVQIRNIYSDELQHTGKIKGIIL